MKQTMKIINKKIILRIIATVMIFAMFSTMVPLGTKISYAKDLPQDFIDNDFKSTSMKSLNIKGEILGMGNDDKACMIAAKYKGKSYLYVGKDISKITKKYDVEKIIKKKCKNIKDINCGYISSSYYSNTDKKTYYKLCCSVYVRTNGVCSFSDKLKDGRVYNLILKDNGLSCELSSVFGWSEFEFEYDAEYYGGGYYYRAPRKYKSNVKSYIELEKTKVQKNSTFKKYKTNIKYKTNNDKISIPPIYISGGFFLLDEYEKNGKQYKIYYYTRDGIHFKLLGNIGPATSLDLIEPVWGWPMLIGCNSNKVGVWDIEHTEKMPLKAKVEYKIANRKKAGAKSVFESQTYLISTGKKNYIYDTEHGDKVVATVKFNTSQVICSDTFRIKEKRYMLAALNDGSLIVLNDKYKTVKKIKLPSNDSNVKMTLSWNSTTSDMKYLIISFGEGDNIKNYYIPTSKLKK